MKRLVIIHLLALSIGLVAGALLGGGTIHTIMSQFVCICIGVPVFIVLIFTIAGAVRRKDRTGLMNGFAVGGGPILLCIAGFTGGGVAIFQYREAEARDFVNDTLPLLDAHKTKFGQYPVDLAEVTNRKLPYYFLKRKAYISTGNSFMFYYENPSSIMGGLLLTNDHRSWSRAD